MPDSTYTLIKGRKHSKHKLNCLAGPCERSFEGSTAMAVSYATGYLTDDEVTWYLGFLRSILTTLHWRASKATLLASSANGVKPSEVPAIRFRYHTHENPNVTLLYTSAFRYLDNARPLIRALYRNRRKSLDAIFRLFQQMHIDVGTGEGRYANVYRKEYKNIESRGLCFPYRKRHRWYANRACRKPISLALFMRRIKGGESDSVQSHFATRMRKREVPVPRPVAPPAAPAVTETPIRLVLTGQPSTAPIAIQTIDVASLGFQRLVAVFSRLTSEPTPA